MMWIVIIVIVIIIIVCSSNKDKNTVPKSSAPKTVDWDAVGQRIAEILSNVEHLSRVPIKDSENHQTTYAEILGNIHWNCGSYSWILEIGLLVDDRFSKSYGAEVYDKHGGQCFLVYPYPSYDAKRLEALDKNERMRVYKDGYGIWGFYLNIPPSVSASTIRSHLNALNNPYIKKALANLK